MCEILCGQLALYKLQVWLMVGGKKDHNDLCIQYCIIMASDIHLHDLGSQSSSSCFLNARSAKRWLSYHEKSLHISSMSLSCRCWLAQFLACLTS